MLLLCGCRVLLDPDEYDGVGNTPRDGDGGPPMDGGPPSDAAGPVFSGPQSSIICDDSEPLHFDWSQLGDSLGVASFLSGRYVVDTDTGQLTGPGLDQPVLLQLLTQRNGQQAYALVVSQLQTESDTVIRATGEHPLIIAGTLLAVSGTIDVSSILAEARGGSGSDLSSSCDAAPGNVGQVQPGSGGGGGGFRASGGRGGDGNINGGQGGSQAFADVLTGIRGGCPGRQGGTVIPGNSGGFGGGAIQLTACVEVSLTGARLVAGGAGGEGGEASGRHGGAGGGSGGYIGLEASIITFMASTANGQESRIVANGGGGGGGSTAGNAGDPGEDGSVRDDGAMGGAASGGMGNGGNGGAVGSESGAPGTDGDEGGGNGGGGGGGGGVGAIVLRSLAEQGAADFSPVPFRCPTPPTQCDASSALAWSLGSAPPTRSEP